MMQHIAERIAVDEEKASRYHELYKFIQADDYDSDAVQLDADAAPSSCSLSSMQTVVLLRLRVPEWSLT